MHDYPTEAEVQEIADWEDRNFPALLARLKEIWKYADCGFWTEEPYAKGTEYRISTGGWSGNEELITALEKAGGGFFWFFCWQQSRRGGHYIFHVPNHERARIDVAS